MTITNSVQQEFLDDETKDFICIPCISTSAISASAAVRSRVSTLAQKPLPITQALLLQVPLSSSSGLVRTAESTKGERWTEDEHERFLLGMELFKAGPWKKIASVVGTRDARQTMSHAQKYRQKIKRRKFGLPTTKPPHRGDGFRCTTTTKRLRTARPVEIIPTATGVANRVVGNSTSHDVSPSVQSPREALGDSPNMINGQERGSAETVRVTSATDSVGSNAHRLMTEDRLNQQLQSTLEPLDIATDVSVAHNGWLGPDELWDFLDGRPIAAPDVVGACAGANADW